jgi:starch phosphorylase
MHKKGTANAREQLWELMGTYLGRDSRSIQKQIVNHIEYTLGLTRFNFKDLNAYQATAFSVRDRLIEQLNDANEFFNVWWSQITFLVSKL